MHAARPRLYFSPLACSLASRIACYEAGAEIDYVQVDTRTKRFADGADYFAVNPMGQVPVLELEGGERLTENAAILQYLADRFADAGLGPRDGLARFRLQQWLAFIATELHKAVFVPLLERDADPAVKRHALAKARLRLDVLDAHLANRAFLLDEFGVADAYAATVLNWAPHVGVDLAPWPAVAGYHRRIAARPAVARAIGEEFGLWRAAQQVAA